MARKALILLVLGAVLLLQPLDVSPRAAADPAITSASAAAGDRKRWTPNPGVVFNEPRDRRDRGIILRRMIRLIDNTPRKEKIRIATWNLASPGFVDALLRAHNRRNVSVRLLMSRGKAEEQTPRESFGRLRRGLSQGNGDRPASLKSWARTCHRSCRGERGVAHTKTYVFSQVGDAKYVVGVSSANATSVAAEFQWNDFYTVVGNQGVYDKFIDIFRQSARDRRADPPYQIYKGERTSAYWFPWGGRTAQGDRVLNELRRIECRGARDGAGIDGRTSIRIAMDAWLDDRGIRIAERIKRLHNEGCNIRVIYAVMGNNILDIMRRQSGRGPVPIQQVVQDFNGDGVYDRYLHSKVMVVSGVYRKDRSAHVVWNGSENWSGLALLSDEAGLKLFNVRAARRYTQWMRRLDTRPPVSRPVPAAVRASVDPYAQMEHN